MNSLNLNSVSADLRKPAGLGAFLASAFLILSAQILPAQILPAQSPGGAPLIDETGFPRVGAIAGNSVNIRTGPSTNHGIITQLPNRTPVLATGKKGVWTRFALPPAAKVWISQRFVESTPDGYARVTGNRVQLRANPNTAHRSVGEVTLGALLVPTGKIDTLDSKFGPWVQVDAPAGTNAWIHGRYLQLGDQLTAAQAARFYTPNKPKPQKNTIDADSNPTTVTQVPKGEVAEPPHVNPPPERPDDVITFKVPPAGGELLKPLLDRLRAEHAKPITQWKFEPILTDLTSLASRSEDLVIAETARDWSRLVRKHWLPTQIKMEAWQKEFDAARRAEEIAKAKEISDATVVDPPIVRANKFVATGWVSTLGKYRKVDGTHRLLKGNKLLYHLKSEQLKLDDYVNKRVGISGVIQEQSPDAGAQLILVTKIEVLSN